MLLTAAAEADSHTEPGLVFITVLFCQAKGLEQLLATAPKCTLSPRPLRAAGKGLHPAPLITSPTAPRLRNALQLPAGASVPLSDKARTPARLPCRSLFRSPCQVGGFSPSVPQLCQPQ